MNRKLLSKLGLLASLYISQGIPHGFRLAAPVIFRERGLTLKEIGVYTFLLYLPWVGKLFLAPVVDVLYLSRFGRRRSWILPMQALMAMLVVTLAFLGESISLNRLLLLLFAVNLASAIQDIATDGYGVDILEPHERGWGNGIQTGGYWAGYMIGGGLIMVLISLWGWEASFVCMAILIATAGIPAWLTRERRIEVAQVLGSGLLSFLLRKTSLIILLFLMLYRGAEGFIRHWVTTMLNDMGYHVGEIGLLQGLVGPVAGIFGALLGGFLMRFIDRRRALLYFGLLQLVYYEAWIYVTVYELRQLSVIIPVVIVDQMISSMVIVATFTFMMDTSNREHGATDYTIQDCAGILAALITTVISGTIAETSGYVVSYLTGMGTVLLSLLVLYRLIPASLFGNRQGDDPATGA